MQNIYIIFYLHTIDAMYTVPIKMLKTQYSSQSQELYLLKIHT